MQFKYKELINFDESTPDCICKLSNNNLLVSTVDSLMLYDENYELQKTISSFANNKKFKIASLASNDEKSLIYVSDMLNHQIKILDLDFTELKSFGKYGFQGVDDDLNKPQGIFYHNDSLYVCDCNNKRIVKLKKTLECIENSYFLNYQPNNIKISNNHVVCIQPNNVCCINFYNLTNTELSILHQYIGHCGLISELNGFYFYEYYAHAKRYYCYNQFGDLINEIKISDDNTVLCSYRDGFLMTFYSSLVLISQSKKKLLLIE